MEGESVGAFVGASVGAFVGTFVGASVGAFGAFVGASVGAGVGGLEQVSKNSAMLRPVYRKEISEEREIHIRERE